MSYAQKLTLKRARGEGKNRTNVSILSLICAMIISSNPYRSQEHPTMSHCQAPFNIFLRAKKQSNNSAYETAAEKNFMLTTAAAARIPNRGS